MILSSVLLPIFALYLYLYQTIAYKYINYYYDSITFINIRNITFFKNYFSWNI